MTQQPDELNQIAAMIAQLRAAIADDREADRERLEQMRQFFEAQGEQQRQQFQQYIDSQAALNADLRVRQEIQSRQIDGLIEVAEITLNSVQSLRSEFNQHRSDGHGA